MTTWRKNYAMAFAVAVPILVQLGLTALHLSRRISGTEVDLAISGYDPRDLLAGHYLAYAINYEAGVECSSGSGETSVCLRPNRIFQRGSAPPGCKVFVKGTCAAGRFTAGIERYYLPAENAAEIEKAVRNKRCGVRISVAPDGTALVRALLIDGKSGEGFSLARRQRNAASKLQKKFW